MDSRLLAQSMINLAQNLLSSQKQQQSNNSNGIGNNGWNNHSRSRTSGSGLLGDGPNPERNGLLGDGPNVGTGAGAGYNHGGYGSQKQGGHNNWQSEMPNKTNNTKNNKNFLPKIKEEGCKPQYFPDEFNYLAGKYLQCNMCNKDPMWDGTSFVKHLLGNVHNKNLEEKIEKDMARVAKLRKVISNKINSVKESGNSKCGMCDVKVNDIIKHRKEETHQNLKKFIHPHCEACNADFEDRSEWYYHRYSAFHLNNLDKNNFDSNYSPITSKEIDDLLGKLDKWTYDKTDVKKKSVEKEEDDVICLMDDENNKTDENDIDNLDVIGREYIKPINGLFCKLCKKFFMSEKSDILAHCSSSVHVESVQKIEEQTGIKRKAASEFFVTQKKAK